MITAVDGATVDSANRLTSVISEHQPGDKIHLTVRRGGASVQLTATLGTRPASTTA